MRDRAEEPLLAPEGPLGGVSGSTPDVQASADESAPLVSPRQAKAARLTYLDDLRGLLMILQSIDHARMFLSRIVIKHENWYDMPDYQGSLYHVLVRFVTGLCAPGFMMTMGMGITLFVNSRKRLYWSDWKIVKHYFIRGLVLILTQNLMMPNFTFYVTTVLFALGFNIFLASLILLLELRTTSLLQSRLAQSHTAEQSHRLATTFSIACYAIAAIGITTIASATTPTPEHINDDFSWWRILLFLPSKQEMGKKFMSMYAPIPWLGMVLWGVGVQRAVGEWKLRSRWVAFLHAVLGVILFVIFVPIRLSGGFGNINPQLLDPPPNKSFINFLNLVKYPPSIAYTTLTISINHLLATSFLLLSLPSQITPSPTYTPTRLQRLLTYIYTVTLEPLRVYGRSAFFFYVMHFYVYLGFRFIFHALGIITGPMGFFGSQEGNLPDHGFWTVWAVGLWVLYYLCGWYGRFKMTRGPDSLWRLF